MSLIDTPNISIIERYLNLAAFRQELISSNIANIDTPGYPGVVDTRQYMK
jgi:flagellar basal-body rod protein FlgB